MARKNLSLTDITNNILASNLYLEKGCLIVIYNNTTRKVFMHIDFFELVYQGEELFLNFSLKGTTESYDERINLTTVNNVNGVPIHTM